MKKLIYIAIALIFTSCLQEEFSKSQNSLSESTKVKVMELNGDLLIQNENYLRSSFENTLSLNGHNVVLGRFKLLKDYNTTDGSVQVAIMGESSDGLVKIAQLLNVIPSNEDGVLYAIATGGASISCSGVCSSGCVPDFDGSNNPADWSCTDCNPFGNDCTKTITQGTGKGS